MSLVIPYCFRLSDDSSVRRRAYHTFIHTADLPPSLRQVPDDIILEEGYWQNSRGMALYAATMIPKDSEVKAVLAFCHGYSDHISFLKRAEYQRFVRNGIAVVGIDYEGHGRSDGPSGLIYDFQLLVGDVVSYFDQITTSRFPGKKVFLMGESMGGAVAFCAYQENPNLFSGVVFTCPMCKISDEMLPPPIVINLIRSIIGEKGANTLLGYLPISPTKGDLRELSYKLKHLRDLVMSAPTAFGRYPRLTTARELLDATSRISKKLVGFDAPFLVQHGKEDKVTDPKLSQLMFEESSSPDKSIKLYDGMWHTITSGEPEENVNLVFNDAIAWIMERI